MPYSKFYWRDNFADQNLRSVSLAARGLWLDMLSLMGMNDGDIGYLEAAGRPITEPREIARRVGCDVAEVEPLIRELEAANVFSKDERGRIFSRRMVKDAKLSKIRSEVGRKGGNPNLVGPYSLPESEIRTQIPESTVCLTNLVNQKDKQTGCVSEAERIFAAYPKQVAKVSAIEAITAALRKLPFEQLLAKTEAYAKHVKRNGLDLQYVPAPAKWFTEESFNEDPAMWPKKKLHPGHIDRNAGMQCGDPSDYAGIGTSEWWEKRERLATPTPTAPAPEPEATEPPADLSPAAPAEPAQSEQHEPVAASPVTPPLPAPTAPAAPETPAPAPETPKPNTNCAECESPMFQKGFELLSAEALEQLRRHIKCPCCKAKK